jgi:molybdopterin converting factor small subunit
VTIEVHLFATLTRYLPPGCDGGRAFLDVHDEATIDDVAHLLGIPETLARIALVNGREASPRERLGPSDVVTLFPPLAGGVVP